MKRRITKKSGFASPSMKQPIRQERDIVFGPPCPLSLGSKDWNQELWVTEEDGKIGMDGGAVYGGVLHGILFDENGMRADVCFG